MENEELNRALSMTGAEREAWGWTVPIMVAGVVLGVAVGLILAPDLAVKVIVERHSEILSNLVALEEAKRQAALWGISAGPDRMALYLAHLGKDTLMWTNAGVGVATGAFTTAVAATRNALMGRHPA